MSFRGNLQHLRAESNMTQERLAMLLGVSRQSVTKWASPELDKLLKMCRVFDCTLDDLVQGGPDQRPKRKREYANAGRARRPGQDVCGYDEHQRGMAWKVPTGIACVIVGVALGFFFEGAFPASSHSGHGGAFIIFALAGTLAGLAFLIPAGMAHSAFVKAHPFVEDFYTEEDRSHARTAFSRGLVGGIAATIVGLPLMFAAPGVWNIVHYGPLLGRISLSSEPSVKELLD